MTFLLIIVGASLMFTFAAWLSGRSRCEHPSLDLQGDWFVCAECGESLAWDEVQR